MNACTDALGYLVLTVLALSMIAACVLLVAVATITFVRWSRR